MYTCVNTCVQVLSEHATPEKLAQLTSPELVQQRKPSNALTGESRKRGSAPSYVEKLKMIVDRGDCETNANGWKHGVRQMMADNWGDRVAPNYADRPVRKIRSADRDDPDLLERKERSDKNVPKVLTPQARMLDVLVRLTNQCRVCWGCRPRLAPVWVTGD